MVNYKCIRCGYDTNDKSKMKTHFSRKTMCKPRLNDIILDDYKYDILEGKIINLQNESKMNPNESKKRNSESKMNPNESKKRNSESKKEYNCEFCYKIYSTNSNLNKHYKRCKDKREDEQCKRDMMELVKRLNDKLTKKDEQIDELIKKVGITQNIQNNIQNNIQQNIKILAFKNTDLSHLTDQDYIYCLNRSNMCIPQLIKRIHFDPEKPENHNIYISNLKNKYIMIYDGIKWNLQSENETIEDLIDTNDFVLEQKLEEWMENGKDYPEIMNKFNRYLEKKENDDVINKIKNEIKLILYNNRKVVGQIDL